MLDIATPLLEDQVRQKMSLEVRVARIESDVAHLKVDLSDVKIDVRQFRSDMQDMRSEMHAGFEAANDATARLALSLCETRVEQKNLRGEQEALRAEQQAMRTDLQAMRADQQAMRTDLQAMRVDQQAMRTDLEGLRKEQQSLRGDLSTQGAELKGEIAALRQEVKALISDSQTKMILWTVATIIAVAGLAFSIAKFIH